MVVVFGIFLIGLVVVALVGYFGYLAAKKRREEFSAMAAARGWTWVERDDRFVDRFSGSPFGTGDDRKALNVVTGPYDGRPMVAFDYSYTTTETSTDAQGRTSTRTVTHPFSVIALDVGVALPELSVSPEGFFGRLVGRLINNDIELESEQFNRAFTVHCPDRKFATDVLHPLMMEYLLTVPDLSWSFRDGGLVAITSGQHSMASLDATLTAIDGILDRIPPFVRQQLGLD
ncbi:DUF3137 domain-containing protein [Nocardioides marmoriginsengisoli]|uniref:DUF3137 domain-containing protein n=1 Tax=Nocardioides marmoriginsengisoli TaxID=661483 RepID=A0A3N0C948_9ACTN|nr:DUF3137 domain-containing protein [Nocardioides marmoriginsengisoli]RNL59970.1 DUF3137 domain-containing protein [Nocardioides marmoriginsengisoli]